MHISFCLFSTFIFAVAVLELPTDIATIQNTSNANNLNINLPERNAILRLEVELRDKNARRRPNRNKVDRNKLSPSNIVNGKQMHQTAPTPDNYFVPMEKVSST